MFVEDMEGLEDLVPPGADALGVREEGWWSRGWRLGLSGRDEEGREAEVEEEEEEGDASK
jgi:hypothetical protein